MICCDLLMRRKQDGMVKSICSDSSVKNNRCQATSCCYPGCTFDVSSSITFRKRIIGSRKSDTPKKSKLVDIGKHRREETNLKAELIVSCELLPFSFSSLLMRVAAAESPMKTANTGSASREIRCTGGIVMYVIEIQLQRPLLSKI